MYSMSFVSLDVDKVDFEDQLYRFSSDKDLRPLMDSIKAVGVVSPLIVEKTPKKTFRLVAGFRRFECLLRLGVKQFSALLADYTFSRSELFQMALHENISVRQLDPVEISSVIHILETNLLLTKKEITENYLPLLGYGRNPRVYKLYKPLKDMSKEWQRAIINEKVAVETAFELSGESREIQLAYLDLIKTLHLGRNRQREFWSLIGDIARMENENVSQLLDHKNLRTIEKDEKFTTAQKTDRYKTELWRMRYSRYSEVKEKFDSLLHEAKLPPEVHLQPPHYFEGEKFSLALTFKTTDDLTEKLKTLEKNIHNEIIQKMIDLT